MKLRALFLFLTLSLLLPAPALAQTATTSTSTPQKFPKPVCAIRAVPGSVTLGQSTNLSWTSQNATGGTITAIGSVGPTGVQGVIPTARNFVFEGTFTGPGGTAKCGVTVSVGTGTGGGSDSEGSGSASSGVPPSSVGSTNGAPRTSSGAGLVPCNGADCQACHLAGLAQNIINFLVGLSIPLAAAMFAVAGIIYFTGETVAKKTTAHSIFINVGIGFVIVITAWLGIQTILKTVLAPSYYQNWNEIRCVADASRARNVDIGSWLQSVLPALNTTVVQQPTSGGLPLSTLSCPNDSYILNNGVCTGGDGPAVPATYTAPASNSVGGLSSCSNSGCDAAAYERAGFEPQEAQAMACIAMTENGGNAVGCTGNACGAMQIMITLHPLVGPACAKFNPTGGEVLNCPALCKGINGAAVRNEASCQPCVQAANNAECNAQTTQELYARDGYSPWLGAAAGGSSDNTKSASCVQKYDPLSDSL